MDFEVLGFTQEELQDRVVAQLVELIIDGDHQLQDERMWGELKRQTREHIDAAVRKIGEETIAPQVDGLIAACTLQQTNKWGEQTGEPCTFKEYLVKCAEAYLSEEVDLYGRTKDNRDYSSSSTKETRLIRMVHNHLKYSIESALKEAVKIVNDGLSTGLQETVKAQMKEITDKLSVKILV